MNDHLRERRKRTWLLYIVRGVSHTQTCERVAEEFDEKITTIKQDIHRMDDWLPKLDKADLDDGVSQMREARENRQRLQQMALKARQNDNLELELKIRRRIDAAIGNDIDRAQSLGEIHEEPDKSEVAIEGGDWFDQMDEAIEGGEVDLADYQ